VTLREVRWQDIPALAELERSLFGAEAWSEPTWWAELAQRPRRSYTALATGDVITAYGGLDHGGEVADIMTVAVAPGQQGRGTGTRVVRHLMAEARERGARHLMLEVRADNLPAQRLYERMGFGLVRTRRRYYQPDDVDALVMRVDLERGAATPGAATENAAATKENRHE
jgi:ribosomal-protein-alanine N-acetyltransferase